MLHITLLDEYLLTRVTRIRVAEILFRMNPQYFRKLDPDPHLSEKLDPDPH
jgi:hypothetical protein